MAHIRKHPVTSRPQVRWRDPSGRERSKTFARATDAPAYMAMINHEASLGELWDRSLQKTPFAEVAAAWLKGKVGLRRSSWVRDESYLRRHVLPYFGGREVGSITRQEVSDWVRGLCEAPPASERWPASPVEGASDRRGERQPGEGLWSPAGDGSPAEAPLASEASGRRGERPKGASPSGPGASPSGPGASPSGPGASPSGPSSSLLLRGCLVGCRRRRLGSAFASFYR